MKWLVASVLLFIFGSFTYSQDKLFGNVYQAMKDKDILVKTVQQMPEQKFIDRLREDGVQFDVYDLVKMGSHQRVNFATAYAQECINKKLWAEAIEILDAVKGDIEFCVDPARFFFTKATAEFMLGRKAEAQEALDHLSEVPDTTRRYTNLAMLMANDMTTWNESDLGYVNRRMREVADRLGNGQGGKKTQKLQKEILVRLDELIKEKENKSSGKCKLNDNSCPDGGSKPQNGQAQRDDLAAKQATNPANDSKLPAGIGQGIVDKKAESKLIQNWGNLPEKERVAVQQGLERRVPEKYRGMIRTYLQAISNKSENK